MKKLLLPCIILFCFCKTSIFAQATIHVPGEYAIIQHALNAAEEGVTILVAPGIYYENLIWPTGVNDVMLIGEFGKETTIIDGRALGRVIDMEGSYGEDPYHKATLQGFTIQNGLLENESGAGAWIRQLDANLSNLIIKENQIDDVFGLGAGMCINSYKGTIENCDFIDNKITTSMSAKAAGLYIGIGEETTLKNCSFSGNELHHEGIAYGGGLVVDLAGESQELGHKLNILNCKFNDNLILSNNLNYGAGAYIDYRHEFEITIDSCQFKNNVTEAVAISEGGGLYLGSFNTKILNSSFISNQASNGAGISYRANNTNDNNPCIIENTIFENNIVTKIDSASLNTGTGSAIFLHEPIHLIANNCVMYHNIGTTLGWSIYGDPGGEKTVELNHCTVAFNSEHLGNENLIINATNSIFWKNGEEEIISEFGDSTEVNLKHCIVSNGYEGEMVMDEDPEFISEYLLIPKEESICLGGGLPLGLSNDYSGFPRPLPLNSYPDIGAYEIDQYNAYVHVKFFMDLNEDGIKSMDEPYISLGAVLANDETSFQNFRAEGIYIILPQGPGNIKYDPSLNVIWQATGQQEYSFLVDEEDFSQSFEFGLTPRIEITDAQSIIGSAPFRCGEEIDFAMTLKNRGTKVVNGIAWLHLDNRLEDFFFFKEPDLTFGDHSVGWEIIDLFPGETLEFDFIVTAPLIENEDQVGELYCFISELEIEDNARENDFNYKTPLRCSFDPNDKLVNPLRSDNLALNDEDLVYTIRFQNTGNDYARNVVVTDTIDENLDMTTFKLTNSSHPDQLQVIIADERAVRFEFNGIYLLDSLTNEPESHGHINYSIAPLEGVELNTNITNTAHIYFDFNPAIVTNTTNSILVDEFPTVSTNDVSELNIQAYPIPATNVIHLSTEVDQVKVYDAQGKLVSIVNNKQTINARSLESGTYFVEYLDDGKIGKDKWIILR